MLLLHDAERFVPVMGYEGLYEVSNYGKVKSLEKYKGSGYKQLIAERIMKPHDNSLGYVGVSLCKKGKKRGYYLQVLVAMHFVKNPENKPEVNHEDGNKLNNAYWNLKWVTRLENERHAWKTGLKGRGDSNKCSIPIFQYNKNGCLIKRFPNAIFVKDELGFNNSVIQRCARGNIKTAYGFIWTYK